MEETEQGMTHQPAISFPVAFHSPSFRAGGRTSNVRQENPDAHLHYVLCGRCEYDACDVELRIDLDLYRARNPACRGIDDYEGLLLGEGQGP